MPGTPSGYIGMSSDYESGKVGSKRHACSLSAWCNKPIIPSPPATPAPAYAAVPAGTSPPAPPADTAPPRRSATPPPSGFAATRILVVGVMLRRVEPGRRRLLQHRARWFVQRDEQPDFRLFPLHVALQRGNHTPVHVAALDLHHDSLGPAAVVVKEVDNPVDARVRALSSCLWPAARPPG